MVMKNALSIIAAVTGLAGTSSAALSQSAVYRCGNEYLNDAAVAASRGCQLVEGGHVTVVPGTRVNPVAKAEASPAVASVPVRSVGRNTALNNRPKADAAAQRARDSDARSILLAELMTAETRLAEQQQAYNNGTPEKLPTEVQHPQRYQERVNELKEGVQRYSGDIAGLKREIARLPAILPMTK